MKKFFFLLFAFAAVSNATGQNCSGCTVTISGPDSNPHVVGPGSKLCITATGVVMGNIAVTGGTLCNEGIITSNAIAVTSGAFNNYGNVTLDSILVSGSGSITNDSTITVIAFGVSSGGTLTNNGTIDCDSIGVKSAFMTNSGTLNVNFDMGVSSNSSVSNYGAIGITGDFGNSSGSTFTNECVVSISSNWYNSAIIVGSGVSCGRWVVDGVTANSGTFSVTGKSDMCDQGMPPGGFDANSGTIGAAGTNVTYCVCTAQPCIGSVSVEEQEAGVPFRAFPNPSGGNFALRGYSGPVRIYNVMGALSGRISPENGLYDVSFLPSGLYFIIPENGTPREAVKLMLTR